MKKTTEQVKYWTARIDQLNETTELLNILMQDAVNEKLRWIAKAEADEYGLTEE